MIALDTNVLIRLIIFDDPMQSGIADDLIRNNRIFISKGVLIESEWVLRYRYKFQREQIAAFMQNVLDASNTLIEDEQEVRSALEWYSLGTDFADALHLAAALVVAGEVAEVMFVSADDALNAAARAEGLLVENPNAHT